MLPGIQLTEMQQDTGCIVRRNKPSRPRSVRAAGPPSGGCYFFSMLAICHSMIVSISGEKPEFV
jgi:hypothetical protein